MPEIEWTPENVRTFWAFLAIVGFFAAVGAVTTLRFLIGVELRARARSKARRSMQKWASTPRPPRSSAPAATGEPRPKPSPGHPLRLDDGPRDWEQRLTD